MGECGRRKIEIGFDMTRRPFSVGRLTITTLLIASSVAVSSGIAWSDVLVGDATIAPSTDTDAAGSAEAFQATAPAPGTMTVLNVYVDSSSSAKTLVAGLYSDSGGHAGTLLAQGSLSSPAPGTWNTVSIPTTTVSSGVTYWIALLGTGGTLAFRDHCCGGGTPSESSVQSNLNSLPGAWSPGHRWSDGSVSAYGSSTAPPPPPPPPPSGQQGQWGPVMSWPLVALHSILTHTGNVLLMDGWQTPNQTQVFNPATQAMTSVPNGLGRDIFCSGHATLADGRVVVVGGDSSSTHSIDAVTVFDPTTNQWADAAHLNTARWYPTVTELGDGRLVAISGQITLNTWADTPEIYDPGRNTWTSLPTINTSQVHGQEYPLSYLLPNGKILTIAAEVGQSFVLDPVAPSWTAAGGPTLMNGTAAQYRPGKILYSGGGTPLNSTKAAQASAQVIDFNADATWHATGSMNSPRYTQTLTVLPDGKVLAVGGSTIMDDTDPSKAVFSSEEWDPATGAWTTLASMQVRRMYHHTAVLVPDGRVLVAGGGHDTSLASPGEYSGQFYSPPYLFNGPRPTITSAPASAVYGATMTVQTPDAAAISSVALVSLGADTHTLDMNQHFVPLTYTKGAGSLNVSVPSSPSVAPPGYYMLFVLNGAGVPSVASMVQITANNRPPTISITAPVTGSTVSGGAVNLSANASDPSGVSGVQFLVDGSPVGPRLVAPPYSTSWNSTAVPNGSHTIGAQATNSSGIVGSATPVAVTVSNTVRAGPSIDAKVSIEGHGTVTTQPFSTSQPGDVLVAFASSDGPNPGPQTLSVSGGGLPGRWQGG
jgi:hypothetical protein